MAAPKPEEDPSTLSSEYAGMTEVWQTIDDILAGPAKIKQGAVLGGVAGQRYLPKHEYEAAASYTRRLAQAPWRPEFADILQTLTSKPFRKDVSIKAGSARIKDFAEDVDLCGSNLTVFAKGVFYGGVAKREHGILVDYPTAEGLRTKQDEVNARVRPYWVSVPATDILACNTRFVDGREIVDHLRFRQRLVERNGFSEVEVERIRVFEPNLWQTWERRSRDGFFVKIGEGVTTMAEVPFVRFRTGKRPPLEALAYMQIELYQLLSGQFENIGRAAFPMLKGKGLAPPEDGEPLRTGPSVVLYAPGTQDIQTDWEWMSPDADILQFGDEHAASVIADMRRLGMQPTIRRSGDVSATEAAIDGAKAHSAVEAWANALKDALEQALVFTSRWMGEEENAEVEVHTDFSVQPYAQAPLDALAKARENGDLSRKTYWGGLRRFDVLAPDFDPEAEAKAIDAEVVGEDDDEDLGAAQTPPRAA